MALSTPEVVPQNQRSRGSCLHGAGSRPPAGSRYAPDSAVRMPADDRYMAPSQFASAFPRPGRPHMSERHMQA